MPCCRSSNATVITESAGCKHRSTGCTNMPSSRKTAFVTGVFYLLTFVSIPTLFLYAPLHDPNYIVGIGPDTPALIGAVLELIVALACVGTAVTLYPVVKRQNEAVALGFVSSRILEAATIFAGIACILTVVSLRQAGSSANALVTSQALVALYDRMFLLGQGLMPAVNALLLGSLLYQSRSVPRVLPVLGIIGAPLLLASHAAVAFGILERVSTLTGLAALPIALWELLLGIWLIVKGFIHPHAVHNSALRGSGDEAGR